MSHNLVRKNATSLDVNKRNICFNINTCVLSLLCLSLHRQTSVPFLASARSKLLGVVLISLKLEII